MKNPVIYVDVDDTLLRSFGAKRIPMSASVEAVRLLHGQGVRLYCWSSGGGDYARRSAEELGLEACFEAFLPKPEGLLDDVAIEKWGLRQWHPNEASRLLEEILSTDRHR